MEGHSFHEYPRVELPGVEPGSRDPDDVGSTCVGSGCSRARCSGARQHPCPIPPFRCSPRPGGQCLGVEPRDVDPAPLRGVRGGSSPVFMPRESTQQIRQLLVPACFVEVTRAPSARSHNIGPVTVETMSAPCWIVRIVALELSTTSPVSRRGPLSVQHRSAIRDASTQGICHPAFEPARNVNSLSAAAPSSRGPSRAWRRVPWRSGACPRRSCPARARTRA